MAAGIFAALLMPYFTTGLPLYWWPLLFVISLTASILGTLAAPPTDARVLKKFYTTVKPWGFWQPVLEAVKAENPAFEANKNFKKDALMWFWALYLSYALLFCLCIGFWECIRH
jgi:hypothetical protein